MAEDLTRFKLEVASTGFYATPLVKALNYSGGSGDNEMTGAISKRQIDADGVIEERPPRWAGCGMFTYQ